MSFTNPVSTNNITNLSDNKIKLTALPGDKVKSPYDGVFSNYEQSQCNGKVKIKHDINGKTYYSTICGVTNVPQNLVSFTNSKISKGDKIGEMANNNVTWVVTDSSGDSQDITDIFNNKSSPNTTSGNKIDDTKTKSNLNTKEKNTKYEPASNRLSNVDPFTKRLFSGLLSPFGVVSDFFDSEKREKEREERKNKEEEKKNKKQQNEDRLTEEINRIKELLK
jgi:hypothetical protein